jgi:BMFP domain-containing protein YqiC
MRERPRFFDDIAGVAGGALSVLVGLREEVEAMVRSAVDETLRRLDLVRREEFDVVQEVAVQARQAQEQSEARFAAIEARLAALEMSSVSQNPTPEP